MWRILVRRNDYCDNCGHKVEVERKLPSIIKGLATVGKWTLIAIAVFPMVYCASALDQQAVDRNREIGCANGEKYFLNPLSKTPVYERC